MVADTVKLSRSQLAGRTGYSAATTAALECGYDVAGRPIGKAEWKSYRLAYAFVHWNCVEFNWQDKNVENIEPPVQAAEVASAQSEYR
jgi:hypothetical protein